MFSQLNSLINDALYIHYLCAEELNKYMGDKLVMSTCELISNEYKYTRVKII